MSKRQSIASRGFLFSGISAPHECSRTNATPAFINFADGIVDGAVISMYVCARTVFVRVSVWLRAAGTKG